jgi:nucleoside-diphosphate-sugar epimerase
MNAVLIVGCGDIGMRVARRYAPASVTGVVRSKQRVAELQAEGFTAQTLDLDVANAVLELRAGGTRCFYFAPPPGAGETDPRVAAVCAALVGPNRPEKVVYISTSAVYGDCGGRWIDESAELKPGTARGRRRLDAESRWLDWGDKQGVPVVILRVPGIYGPGRAPIERLKQGLPVLSEQDAPFTNRIHAEDLASVCVAAMRQGRGGQAYNVADGHPTTMTDYFNRVADAFGLPRPPVVDRSSAEQALTPAMLSFLSESKRLVNRKMLDELQVSLTYPDLSVGLAKLATEGEG